MKKNICKITTLINIALLILLCLIMTFGIILMPYDELWNFQNVFKMFNGFQIYKDCNVIITPLFFYLENFIFHIFSANFLVFRLSNIFIVIFIFLSTYYLQKSLKVNKTINLLFVSLILFDTFYLYASNGPNYNTLALMFYTIGLATYFSKKNSNIFQGVILFLIFFTKQNTAIFYLMAIVIYELYKYKFSKTFFTNQLKKLLVFSIPFIIVLGFYYLNNNLNNFFNYTFGGLFDFSKGNFSFTPEAYDLSVIIMTYAVSIAMIFSRKKLVEHGFSKDFFENILILLIFSSCATLIVFPIFNSAHTKMIIPFFFVILAYIFSNIFYDFFDDHKMKLILNVSITILLAIFVIKTFLELFLPMKNQNIEYITDVNSPYFGISLLKEEIENINILKKYIISQNEKGIDVIICSHKSAFTTILLNQSHGAYDLIFYGNLGFNGVEKMKQDILSKNNTEFLIVNDEEDMFDQEVTEIRDFIINNLTIRGEILNYNIYSK